MVFKRSSHIRRLQRRESATVFNGERTAVSLIKTYVLLFFCRKNSRLIVQNVLASNPKFHRSPLTTHRSSLKKFFCPISIPIAVVLRCPFKISSTAVAVYLRRPMQYICSEKPMRWPDKVTALHPLTYRIVFAHAPHCVFSFTAHRLIMARR